MTQQGENTNGSNEEVDRSRWKKRHEVHSFAQNHHTRSFSARKVGTQIHNCFAQAFREHQVACDRQETREQSQSKHTESQQSKRPCDSQSQRTQILATLWPKG